MEENKIDFSDKVVVIGGSAGSLEVLLHILPKLVQIDSITIVLVLHRRNADDVILEDLLRMKSGLKVREIEDKTPIKLGRIYVVPANYHLLVETNRRFSLDVSEKVHFCRPSIDVGFKSIAEVFSSNVVAILLSGANSDGTEGLQTVKDKGGITIIQSPETAEVAYMPAYALKHMKPDHVFSPDEIAEFIKCLIKA